MDKETDELVSKLRSRMELMSDCEREELVESLTKGYCKHCLSEDEPCYCWNDD